MLTTKMKQYITLGVIFTLAVGGFSNFVKDPALSDSLNILAVVVLVYVVRRIRKNSNKSSLTSEY